MPLFRLSNVLDDLIQFAGIYKRLGNVVFIGKPNESRRVLQRRMAKVTMRSGPVQGIVSAIKKTHDVAGQPITRGKIHDLIAAKILKGPLIGGTVAQGRKGKKIYINRNVRGIGLREIVHHEGFHNIPVVGQSEMLAHFTGGLRSEKGRLSPLYGISSIGHLARTRPGRFGIEAAALASPVAAGAVVARKRRDRKEFSQARKLFDKVIQFKALYQPGKKDEPPEELPELKGVVDYTVQRHAAKRAGLHRDIRIGTKRHGLLSWATRKDLPKEGERTAIHPQPVHPHSYLGWEGDIAAGYGAGRVSTEHLGKALITKSTPTEVHATLADQREHHRVAFLKTAKGWLLTRGKRPEPPKEARKPKYKSVSPEKAHEHLKGIEAGTIVQPKVDGALVYVTTKGGRPEIFSHRVSKVSGKHPVHTERVFGGRPAIDIPRHHQRTLIGELYGTKGGKAIEPQELGGLLNTHIGESLQKIKSRGIKLKVMPFDYANGKGESYPERLAKVKETVRHLPKDTFHTPEEATTPGAARRLFNKIRSLRHPLTKEGVIVHPPHGRMVKIKNVEEANVTITGTFPGEGKFKGSHGGITYKGGRVGTGFSDETRRELHKYVGRKARIRHQGKYPSGAYRAPSFIAVEENK